MTRQCHQLHLKSSIRLFPCYLHTTFHKGAEQQRKWTSPPSPQFFHPRISISFKLFAKNFKKTRTNSFKEEEKKNENCHRAERNNPNNFPVISKFPPNFFQEMKKFKLPAQFNSRSQWRFAMKCQTGIYLNLRWVIGINCLTWSTIFCLWVIV